MDFVPPSVEGSRSAGEAVHSRFVTTLASAPGNTDLTVTVGPASVRQSTLKWDKFMKLQEKVRECGERISKCTHHNYTGLIGTTVTVCSCCHIFNIL